MDWSDYVHLCRAHAVRLGARRAFTFTDGDAEIGELTFEGLDRAAMSIAAVLQGRGLTRRRILLLLDSAQDFIEAFVGCLYAGAVAVPVNVPKGRQRGDRLRAIAENAGAAAILATSATAALEDARLALDVLDIGLIREGAGSALRDTWKMPDIRPDDAAFLQYTSGSTGTPRGVIVSHGNLVYNEAMIEKAFGHDENTVFAGWLPLFHDMGLVGNVLHPLYLGVPCVLMPPVTFVQTPARWLRMISRYRATTSGAPNFAYELCVRRIDESDLDGIDLSSWKVAFNGAEPIRAETLARFCAKFARFGFSRRTFYPCYGMAEATLFVSGGISGEEPRVSTLRTDLLETGVASSDFEEGNDDSEPERGRRQVVGCGRTWLEQRIAIVDSTTLEVLGDGQVGEIWVSGPNVARAYWGRENDPDSPFGCRTKEGSGPYLRTGDLGFLRSGELYVTGRIKDVIIVAGRNHYPQDIEHTVAASHEAFAGRPGAAFVVPSAGQEKLVFVQELNRRAVKSNRGQELRGILRDAVVREHGIAIRDVVLIGPCELPMTTSGKVQRTLCRTLFLDGKLRDRSTSEASESAADVRRAD